MPTNKNALIRYRTIDKCLQNSSRAWTLDDLSQACSDALFELENRETSVSKRTTQLDIQTMRGDKLGYFAPIENYDKKYYRYSDPVYSISDVPLTELDMDTLQETLGILKQFRDFSLFREVTGILQKLEDCIHVEKGRSNNIIHIERNEQLKGLEHLDLLYQSILKEIVLKINYQSFKARHATQHTIVPYILKEFNNRWFLVGRRYDTGQLITLALDRIEEIDYDTKAQYKIIDFDSNTHYDHTIGVTVYSKDTPLEETVLLVDESNAPYILTKPLHKSQRLIKKMEDRSVIVGVTVQQNYEWERLILGFGPHVEVLAPRNMRRRIKRLAHDMVQGYDKNRTSTRFWEE